MTLQSLALLNFEKEKVRSFDRSSGGTYFWHPWASSYGLRCLAAIAEQWSLMGSWRAAFREQVRGLRNMTLLLLIINGLLMDFRTTHCRFHTRPFQFPATEGAFRAYYLNRSRLLITCVPVGLFTLEFAANCNLVRFSSVYVL